jgi:CheY-like chemotaxis protein
MSVDPSATGLTRVLMIDDDKKLCRLVTAYLEPLGFDVTAVHTGPEGVERATAVGATERGQIAKCELSQHPAIRAEVSLETDPPAEQGPAKWGKSADR